MSRIYKFSQLNWEKIDGSDYIQAVIKKSTLIKELKAVEVELEKYQLINSSKELPFEIADATNINEDTRYRYRYLDLRRPRSKRLLLLKSQFCQAARNFLHQQGFVDLETPILAQSSPEGANCFVVPANLKNRYYTLPQSPQIFKQLLMMGGFAKYYQIGKSFRNEGARSNRQIEFSQLDLELSFVSLTQIKRIIEKLLRFTLKKVFNYQLKTSFAALTYQEVQEKYQTDKPDLRTTNNPQELNFEIEKYEAARHPFTLPKKKYIKLLLNGKINPEKVMGEALDLVCNGEEILSGGLRIYQRPLQEKMLEILGYGPQEREKNFGYFLQALEFAAPPHGGIGLGIDRLLSIILQTNSLKELIAFPKNIDVGDIANLQQTSESQELGRNIQELGRNIQELGRKCCLHLDQFSQPNWPLPPSSRPQIFTPGAAQQIIHAIFHFYQEIGQLTAGKKTQIERKIFPLLAKDYYFASYNAQGLENYVQTIVSKVRNQEARDEHFTGWTTNRPENTVLFFLQQEAAHDRELALARQISLKTINDNLEKLRMINPDLEITSLDPPTLSRQSTISQIEETTDQAQKVIFEHAFAEVKNNLLLLQSVLPLGVYNFLSGKAEQANSVTELLRLNNSALPELQYLDYQQIIVGEETPQQQDINIFLTDRSLICGQICRLLERMAEVDNLNDDSATWSELRLLQSRINNYLHGEESQTRDRFSLRLLTNPQNSYYVERRQRKLEEKIQSYLEEEQEFIIRLKTEFNAREYQNNSQQIADLVYEINEEINLQKLLDRENLEQATQSPEGTASYQTLDQLLKKDSEDWQELERINYELGLWQQSPQLANDEVVVQNWEHREQRITKRRQEINTKIAAKKQEAETAYWQQQLNNLLTQKSVVISDPSRIKTLQQALVPEQFASDENGINQKEVWSKPENQLAIQEAVQGLEKYYQAFQQLREILNQADELISNSEDWEELNRTAKKIDGWPNQGVYQKNAVEVWQDQVKNRLEAIEEKLFGLQVVDQVNQGAIEPEAPKADIPLESAEEISRLKALVENPILTTEIKYETP
ncbi:31856_t:CDS:10, partial [Racocetra persica]